MNKSITEKISLTDTNIKELRKQFGYAGIGYYYELIEQMYLEGFCIYPKSKLNRLARKTKISKKNLEKLIKICTQLYDPKDVPLLEENKKYFWNNHILQKYYTDNVQTIKPAGRKKIPQTECIKIKEAELVNLTQAQYDNLKLKYGYEFLTNALKRLNNWLKSDSKKSKLYLNRNNYWLFRNDSWLIRETKLALE